MVSAIEGDDEVELKTASLKEAAEKGKTSSVAEMIAGAQKLKGFTGGVSLASKDANSLEAFETENDERSWKRHIQKVLMGIVALTLCIQILYTNLSKIGKEKSQKSDFTS